MQVCRQTSARAFLDRARPWLLRAEAENGLLLGVAAQLVDDDSLYERPIYLATIERAGAVVGCAFRTPPHQAGLTRMPLEALPALAYDLREVYDGLPGISGPVAEAHEFAKRWTALAGGAWTIRFRQRIYSLEKVVFPPTQPHGALRRAAPQDVDRADRWLDAFAREAGITLPSMPLAERLIRDGRLYIWQDGAPRSMLASTRETPNGASINAVYTPPEFRGRGYATIAVAALSRRLLEAGHGFCSLYTDLANPTSNALYQRVGYRPVADAIEIAFC
jgi:hypothetical protein